MKRRDFLLNGTLATSLVGTGVGLAASAPLAAATAATQGAGPNLRGPYIDLTTGKGNMLAAVRMDADLDESKSKYASVSGIVVGVRSGEALRDLFGFEVVSAARAWKQPDGSYRVLHGESILYTDLESGDILTEYLNPYTNERVRVVDVINDPWNHYFEEWAPRPPSYGGLNKVDDTPREPLNLGFREVGNGLIVNETHINLYYKNALQPDKWPRESAGPMNRVSEFFTKTAKLADLQDPSKTAVHSSGTWVRVTPWLPWMLMGQVPGHIVYHSTYHSFDSHDGFKPKVYAHMRKHHPRMLEAPPKEAWSKPNLSSLEVYAQTEEPAPPL
jgi:hypothetical protein